MTRIALITGGARGIGAAIATALAHDGCDIAIADLPSSDTSAITHTISQLDRQCLVCTGDVSRASDWQQWLATIDQHYGRLDVVVNNAGISGPIAAIIDYPDEAFDQVMAINTKGVFLGIKYGAKAMLGYGNGGNIVNISSNAGVGGSPQIIAYSTSKHAVIGLTKSAAKGFATQGIRVNAVCPAPTDTEMVHQLERLAGTDIARQRLTAGTPMGRYGQPHEIAAAVVFLASPAASFITGAILPVDGGSVA
jgi:NAD(P)-dependent dehydrogenase (short-subunit alcohol dehydrogenase family)